MFNYGVVSGTASSTVINNGHTVQLVIPTGFAPPNASVVVVGARRAWGAAPWGPSAALRSQPRLPAARDDHFAKPSLGPVAASGDRGMLGARSKRAIPTPD